MDGVLVDFQSGIDSLSDNEKEIYEGRYDEVPGIFSKMIPKDGALKAFEKLSKSFEVYILSTAPWDNPSAWTDKLLWVKKNLGTQAHKKLILSHNKHLNAGDFLIDDSVKIKMKKMIKQIQSGNFVKEWDNEQQKKLILKSNRKKIKNSN